MTERELTLALDDLVDPCLDAAGDWSEVLALARMTTRSRISAVPRRARRIRSRRLAIGVTAFLLAGLVFLATGFGRDAFVSLLGRIDINFGASKPAPALIRRDFASLSFGLPPRMSPQALVNQARAVAEFRIGGRRRTLWVAPTRRGGFCWQIEKATGGCLDRRADRRPLVSFGYLGASPNWPLSEVPARIDGVVLTATAERLVAEFRDGSTRDVPFVFVSKPIEAGFFIWSTPAQNQRLHTSLRALTARDGSGNVVARATLPFPRRRPPVRMPPLPHGKPPPPPSALGLGIPAPTPPIEHGRGDGVSVRVGRNGVVVFDTSEVDAMRQRVLHGRLGVGCFRIEYDQAGIWPRELLFERGFGPKLKVRIFQIRHPYDGCEIQAGYGHHWPDRFGSHSAVEVPLTPTGRKYFTDRAAARDLAVFMRENKGTALRRESGEQLVRDLARIGGDRFVRLSSMHAPLPVRKIGYVLAGSAVTYVERSPAGRRFFVMLDAGHIKKQNVKPYAFVY